MGNNNGNGCGCTSKGGGTPYSAANRITGGARKKRGTGKKRSHSKKTKRGGGIISTAAAPVALYGLARMAHRGKRHSKNRTRRRRRTMRGGNPNNNKKPLTNSEYQTEMEKIFNKFGTKKISKGAFDSDMAYLQKKHQKGGSVLGNALPSLVLYGLARGMRGTKKNSNHNGNKTRKMRSKSRRGRRM